MSWGWATPALLVWTTVLLLPWRPWSTRERLDSGTGDVAEDLSDITVLIPARNEATTLPRTLESLAGQGGGLKILVVDDESSDSSAAVIQRLGLADLSVIPGKPLPDGWTGKVWAQEQGRSRLDRRLTLLLDADIELAPGLVACMRRELVRRDGGMLSLMVELSMQGFWERLLLPAFVYFFKLLYPFRLANSRSHAVAAAAGGCILVETRALEDIGGFESLRDALIDDCTLARLVKDRGYPTYIGLTRSAASHRRYTALADIWRMVARTAFTQLRYSWLWLGVCTVLMITCFVSPVALLFATEPSTRTMAALAWLAMCLAYVPTLAYYGLSRLWALAMPVIGVLFLAMTWDSALRYWRGERSSWRGRSYRRSAAAQSDTETSSWG
jgi:hopene-associated glycosyltransferase HpnB